MQCLLKEGRVLHQGPPKGEVVCKALKWPSNPAFYDDGLSPLPLCRIMLLCGKPHEKKDKTVSHLVLVNRAEMLRAALPGKNIFSSFFFLFLSFFLRNFVHLHVLLFLPQHAMKHLFMKELLAGGTKTHASAVCNRLRDLHFPNKKAI